MKKIFRTLALVAAAFALTACVSPIDDIITDLNLKRCLEPMNLNAKIASDGETVTYSWDVPTGTLQETAARRRQRAKPTPRSCARHKIAGASAVKPLPLVPIPAPSF